MTWIAPWSIKLTETRGGKVYARDIIGIDRLIHDDTINPLSSLACIVRVHLPSHQESLL